MLTVTADAGIALAREAFEEFGPVLQAPGRQIGRAMLADTSLLLVRSVTRVDRGLLEGSRVRFVATATSGHDHIDRAWLQSAGIGFAFAPGANARSVAEYVVAALLHCCRSLKRKPADLTLGIVGVGHVGCAVLDLARGLGIRCLLNDPPRAREGDARAMRPLDEVLAESDAITLHVPLSRGGADPTYHLVSPSFLEKMRPGAILINTSRGDVVDERALRRFRARLGALVCDVWHGEPVISLETMAMADIATPHIAGYSHDGKLLATRMIHEAACSFFDRQPRFRFSSPAHSAMVTVDLHVSPDPVFDAVAAAYPIKADDVRLREIVHVGAAQRAAYFDRLRRDYRKRLEFGHYRIIGAEGSTVALRALGFTVHDMGPAERGQKPLDTNVIKP